MHEKHKQQINFETNIWTMLITWLCKDKKSIYFIFEWEKQFNIIWVQQMI